MLEKLLSLYANPAKTASFAESEGVYADYIGQLFTNFADNANNERYYEDVFRETTSILGTSAKIFAELRQLSAKLADALLQTGELIFKIADLYEKHFKVTEKVYKRLSFQPDADVLAINRSVATGLREWGGELVSQRMFVTDSLTSFFHFKKHEIGRAHV